MEKAYRNPGVSARRKPQNGGMNMRRNPALPLAGPVRGRPGGTGAEIWYNGGAVRRRLDAGNLPLPVMNFQEADT